jgi:splicing factor 3B subunit 1
LQTPGHVGWAETPGRPSGGETPGSTPAQHIWDATPAHSASVSTPGHATPGHSSVRRNRWDETPKTERETPGHNSGWAETPKVDRSGVDMIENTPTPSASKRRSRWDETPAANTPSTPATPMTPHTPSMMMTPGGATPMGPKAMIMATPSPSRLTHSFLLL